MLKPEALESYLTISDWKPARDESVEPGQCMRCGGREAAVSICIPCLLEIAARISAGSGVEQAVKAIRRGRRKKRRPRIWEWAAIILFSVGVIVGGSLLSMALH